MDELEDVLWRAIDKNQPLLEENVQDLIKWMQHADKELLQTCIELIKYGLITKSYKEPMGSLMLNYANGLERGLNPKPPSLVPSPVISVANDSYDRESSSEGHEGMISIKDAKAATYLVKTLDLNVRKFYNLFFHVD